MNVQVVFPIAMRMQRAVILRAPTIVPARKVTMITTLTDRDLAETAQVDLLVFDLLHITNTAKYYWCIAILIIEIFLNVEG